MTQQSSPSTPSSGGSGRWLRFLPALTFLAGLGLGSVLVAVGTSGNGDGEASPGNGSPTPTTGASGVANPGGLTLFMPAACREALRNIRNASGLLDDAVGSVRDFKPNELVDVLNRLEELDDQTRPLVQECTAAEASMSVVPSATPSPSPTS